MIYLSDRFHNICILVTLKSTVSLNINTEETMISSGSIFTSTKSVHLSTNDENFTSSDYSQPNLQKCYILTEFRGVPIILIIK